MFRTSTIIRELALNLANVIFTLKHSVKLRRYLLCGCVAACHCMACVFCAVQNAQHTTHKTTIHFYRFNLIYRYSVFAIEPRKIICTLYV